MQKLELFLNIANSDLRAFLSPEAGRPGVSFIEVPEQLLPK